MSGSKHGCVGGGAPGEGCSIGSGRDGGPALRRERPNALTTAKRQRFLDVLAATANAALAAERAGASAQTFYRRRQRDPAFAAAWTSSLGEAYQRLEQELVQHALAAPVEAGDGEAGAIPERPFDPQLAMKVLTVRDGRATAPAGARRTSDYRHVPIEAVERELLRRIEALEKRLRRGGGNAA